MSIFKNLKNIDKSKLAAGIAGLAAASAAAENSKLRLENQRLQEEIEQMRKRERENETIEDNLKREKFLQELAAYEDRQPYSDKETTIISDMHMEGLILYEIGANSDAANSMPRKWMQIWLCESNHIHLWNTASCRKLDSCPHCGRRNIDFISIAYNQPKTDTMIYRRQFVLFEKHSNPSFNRYNIVKSAPTHYLFVSECKKCGKKTDLSWENGLCRQCDPDNINASPVDETVKTWFRINYYLCPNGHINVYSDSNYYWWPSSSSKYTGNELSPCRYCHAKLSNDACYTIYPEETSYGFQFIRTKAPTVESRAEYRVQDAEVSRKYLIFKESHKKLPSGDFQIEYELPNETPESKAMMELIKKREMHTLNLVQSQESQYPNGDIFFQFKIAISNKQTFKDIFVLEAPDEAGHK